METLELFYPRITAQAGGYTFQQGIEIEVSSARDSRMDWAKIRFTDRFKPEISISRLEPATILLGYGGAFDEVFTGYVAKPYSTGSSANEIVLRDPMLLLEDITVNETFLDTTPQEVVRYILAQAGLAELKLTSMVYPARKRLSIRKQSGVQALDAVAAAWGIQVHYFFSGGVFYWGEEPEQSMIYTFEAGRNILSLARRGSLWDLETVSAPFVRHSHRVQVSHPSISGEVEVIRVRHLTNDEGFIRTHIYF
mgnify:FL=1